MGDEQIIAGRFLVDTESERQGGIGTIHRGRDLATGRAVAVKRLRRSSAESDPRFLREAEVLAALPHEGIVRYVAHGVSPEGEPYLVMEWLVGEPLSDRLARGPLPVEQTLRLARRVASALAFAHERGLVHRDIKPANVFLVDGDVEKTKIIDFGVARADLLTGEPTDGGTMVGTLGYMAPEQARGEENVDARADVFALGCVLYKCLSGAAPFVGDNLTAVLAKTLFEEAPRLREAAPDLPRDLEKLVHRMLAKEPSRRPEDGAALLRELSDLDVSPRGSASSLPPPVSRPGITSGEQSLVSVVLATARQAAATDETLPGAHSVREGDALLGLVRGAVGAFGARVDALANGLLIATLSGTASATDQATQAARCALAMMELLSGSHIVLATGRGVLGKRMPVGVAIDRAVRILRDRKRAQPSDPLRQAPVVMDDVTAGLLDTRFEACPVRRGAFALVREHPAPEQVRTLLGKPTPFVGRGRELSVLMATFEACTSEPSAQCALVTGAAGVGKSRLRYELVRTMVARDGRTDVWSGRGEPLAKDSPLRTLSVAVRHSLHLVEGEPPESMRARLRARVGRHVPAEEADRVADFIGELVGVPFPDDDRVQLRAARNDAVLRGDQIRRATFDYLAAECRDHPVVIVLEDFHWGDEATVALVDAALERLRDSPLFILALSRSEVVDRFPHLWAGRALTHVELTELSARASEKLVRDVLGPQATAAVVERLVTRSEGNAFFLEELIRSVAERPDLVELPETVLAMAQARLEALDASARRVLRAASVFGDLFHCGGVVAVLGDDALSSQAAAILDTLSALELVSRRPSTRMPGEAEYVFRHTYVREAAYGTLTETDRALAHRLAGDWLEAAGERDAFALAEHYERAGAPERAALWYRRAAEQALEANALDLAVERAGRGARSASGETLGMLRLVQAEAHAWRGEHAEVLQRGEEAMRWLAPGGELWAEAAGQVAEACGRLGHNERLAGIGERLSELAYELRSGRQVVACVRAATQLMFAGKFELGQRLTAMAERERPRFSTQEPATTAWIDYARSVRALFAGDLGDNVRLKELVVESFERAGDERNACIQRVRLGYAWIALGAHDEGARVLRDALAAAERMRLAKVLALARHNLGLGLLRMGRFDEARAFETEALEAFEAQGDRRLAGACHLYLAWIYGFSGNLASAELHARMSVATQENNPPSFVEALASLARVLLGAGRASEAIVEAKRARDLLDALGGVEDAESMIRLVHARCLLAAGDGDGARTALRAARERILERAGRIKDEGLRRIFLHEEPDNRRTLELAAAYDDRA